jgi:hypothetical protein
MYSWFLQLSWLTKVSRSPHTVATIEADIARAATSEKCALKRSEGHQLSSVDDFEIVATRDIAAGETVLVDRQMIATTDSSANTQQLCSYCCNYLPDQLESTATDLRLFCSTHCLKSALQRDYPTTLSGKMARSDERLFGPTLLLPRLLATYLESPSQSSCDILSHPLVSRWKGDYRDSVAFPFSFEMHIKQPISILENLGVNVFADNRFDTWIMLNILNRISSNMLKRDLDPILLEPEGYLTPPDSPHVNSRALTSTSGLLKPVNITVHSLGYLLTLFNHSCSPNVDIEPRPGGTSIRANKRIKEGEELCVSYVHPEQLKENKEKALRQWFDHCRCNVCCKGEKSAKEIDLPLRSR